MINLEATEDGFEINGCRVVVEFETVVDGNHIVIWAEAHDNEPIHYLIINEKLICTLKTGMGQGTGYLDVIGNNVEGEQKLFTIAMDRHHGHLYECTIVENRQQRTEWWDMGSQAPLFEDIRELFDSPAQDIARYKLVKKFGKQIPEKNLHEPRESVSTCQK